MNIILIVSDTVRSDYCGCYGSPWVRTPAIDRLARQSVLMERFYSGSFPTGPMRKDLLSGRFTFPYASWTGEVPPNEPLVQAVLEEHGYTTAFIGDTGNSPQYRTGFHHEQVIPRVAAGADAVSEEEALAHLPAEIRKLRGGEPWMSRILKNALGWDGEADRPVARTMLAAHRWLEDQTNADTPFFLYVDTFDPHEPWDPPRYYIDRYGPNYGGDELMEPAYERAGYAGEDEIAHMRRMYAAKLSMVDRWLGVLLDGIELMGLADETAVLFTSDHGFYHGEHGLIGKVELNRANRIVGRWPLYDTVAHPPLLVRAPGARAGVRSRVFCQPADLAPTILELAGVPTPGAMQGVSLVPLLQGDAPSTGPRPFAVSSPTYVQDSQVRSPTAFRTDRWLYIYGGDEWASELYDVHADPPETENVFSDHQDVARELHEQYVSFLEEVGCPPESLELRRPFDPQRRPDLPEVKII
jgi:arylsulfatase A-like enzyme